MVSRNRLKTYGSVDSGHALYYNGSVLIDDEDGSSSPPVSLGSSRIIDVVDGTRNDHPLDISHLTLDQFAGFKGTVGIKGVGQNFEFLDYVPYLFSPRTNSVQISLPSLESSATTARARTNPNRPSISLPVLIGEMKDIPGLLKWIGKDLIGMKAVKRNYHQQVGNAYLAGAYGIAPLISDLKKSLDFQSQVAKRSDELKRLHSKGGLKRRITLFEESATGPKTRLSAYGQGNLSLYVRSQTKTTVKRWATLKWLPTSLPPVSPSDADYARQARSILLGMGPNSLDPSIPFWSGGRAGNDPWGALADAWELMPWSWLADWFSNTGDFIQSKRNAIPVTSSRCNVMTSRISTTTFTRNDLINSVSGGTATTRYETKSRFQSSGPSISADFPFLSGHQLSILGALGLQRLRLR